MFTIKKIGSVVGFCTLLLGSIHAQTTNHSHAPGRSCYAHDKLQEQLQQDPALQQRMDDMERTTQRYVQNLGQARNTSTRSIPVYVHVLYNTSSENISDAQIQSQLDQLNADFAGTNSDYNPPSDFSAVAAGNTGIQFTLEAITRKSTTKTSWGTNDAMKSAAQGGVAAVTPSTHLNMWVCNIGGGILGYAQFPGGTASTDGVVMSPQYFGSINYGSGHYLSAPFNKGRTATHEVGHYLNLRHIWGDGNCNADDFVDDTPLASASNYGCPSATQNSCSAGLRDMHMNYMDYTDDACMFMFSAGQDARMWACLDGTRSQLGTAGSGGGGTGGGTGGGGGTSGSTQIYGDYFESGFGNWNDGGSDCARYSGRYSSEGSYSIRLRDNSGTASAMTSDAFDATPYDQITIDFKLYANSMENGEDFSLNYYNGSSWSTVAAYVSGTHFNNRTFYTATVTLDKANYNFASNAKFSFQCDASNNADQVYIDAVVITGLVASARTVGNSITALTTPANNANRVSSVDEMAMKMTLYPNPAREVLNIEVLNTEATFVGRIMDATGKTLWTGEIEAGSNQINLNQLVTGIYYFTAVKQDGSVITKKFIKSN